MDALVMAGGCGTRLDADGEKPLLRIAGTPMIDRVLDALTASRVERVFVATSPTTPETCDHVEHTRVATLVDTPGEGYVADLATALADDRFGEPVLTVAADLPLVARDAIDDVLDAYDADDRDSLTVAVPVALKEALGASVDERIDGDRRWAPSGINVVGGDREGRYRSWDARLAVNVNRPRDASLATDFVTRESINPDNRPYPRNMDPEAVDAVCEGNDGGVVGADEAGRVYHGGSDDPWVLDFSANVNPAVPPGAARVYDAAFASARSYPADDYNEFRTAAANHVGCEPRQVVPTAGGLGAIRLAIATTVQPGDSVLVPAPSFGEYAQEIRLQGGDPVFVDPEAMLTRDPSDHAMVICCTPNNPTGSVPARQALVAFAEGCRAAGTTLLVDEAFLGFTEQRSLAGREGVIVARSLTKLFGLPGLRAGYAVATGSQRERLTAARPAWALGEAAAAVGAHCLKQESFVTETRERVESERERMRERLTSRFDVAPSAAPFLLCDVGSPDAVDDLSARLRAEDIVVRDARSFHGLDSHVRIAVRLTEENDRLLDALDV